MIVSVGNPTTFAVRIVEVLISIEPGVSAVLLGICVLSPLVHTRFFPRSVHSSPRVDGHAPIADVFSFMLRRPFSIASLGLFLCVVVNRIDRGNRFTSTFHPTVSVGGYQDACGNCLPGEKSTDQPKQSLIKV